MQMTHNFSSPFIHHISTPTSVTYKMLYNRSLLIFSLSTLLKLNFFLLDLNNNSVKYRTALSLQPCSQPWFYFRRTPYLLGSNHCTFKVLLLSHPWTSLYPPIPWLQNSQQCHSTEVRTRVPRMPVTLELKVSLLQRVKYCRWDVWRVKMDWKAQEN